MSLHDDFPTHFRFPQDRLHWEKIEFDDNQCMVENNKSFFGLNRTVKL